MDDFDRNRLMMRLRAWYVTQSTKNGGQMVTLTLVAAFALAIVLLLLL